MTPDELTILQKRMDNAAAAQRRADDLQRMLTALHKPDLDLLTVNARGAIVFGHRIAGLADVERLGLEHEAGLLDELVAAVRRLMSRPEAPAQRTAQTA
jgi:hypothetical protein